jgi:hypothetical protein
VSLKLLGGGVVGGLGVGFGCENKISQHLGRAGVSFTKLSIWVTARLSLIIVMRQKGGEISNQRGFLDTLLQNPILLSPSSAAGGGLAEERRSTAAPPRTLTC